MYKYKHAGLNNGRLSGFGTHLKDHKTDEQSACAQSCPLTIPCKFYFSTYPETDTNVGKRYSNLITVLNIYLIIDI